METEMYIVGLDRQCAQMTFCIRILRKVAPKVNIHQTFQRTLDVRIVKDGTLLPFHTPFICHNAAGED